MHVHLQHHVHKPANFVFDYLSDVNKFVSIHPLIQRMVKLGPNNYLVHEEIKIGPLPIRFTYPATVESDSTSKEVSMCATVMRLSTVQMHFQIRSSGENCIIDEDIIFSTWLPIKFVLKRLFKTQHSRLFAKLDSLDSVELGNHLSTVRIDEESGI